MSFTGNENQKNLLFHTIEANAKAVSGEEEGTGGEGGNGMKNVAISDGLMFKIKIVTPEEIRAKQVRGGGCTDRRSRGSEWCSRLRGQCRVESLSAVGPLR
jgi:hypothetical protein